MRNKIIALLLCAVLMLSLACILAGCFSGNASDNDDSDHTASNPNKPDTNNPDASYKPEIPETPETPETPEAPSTPGIEFVTWLEWDGSIASGFAGGDGTESSPYEISSGAELAYLSRQVAMGNEQYSAEGVHYILTECLDLCSMEWSPIGSRYNISGEVDESCTFRGSFDGNGKMIRKVKISEAKSNCSAFGLFGEVSSATIYNIDIRRVDYNAAFGKTTPVGALVGRCTDSTISDCSSGGTVYAERGSAGGLIGSSANSVITDCSSDIDITGAFAGGLICSVSGGSVLDCKSAGKLYAIDASLGSEAVIYGGGFVGFLSGAEIRRSSSSVIMTTRSASYGQDFIGGFVGKSESSSIYDSFATGSITLSSKSSSNGALAAGFLGHGSGTTTIQYCYSRGNVESSSSDYLLGFAGYSTISDCYSTSNVTGGYRAISFCMGSTATRCIAFGDAKGSYASAFNSPRASFTQAPIEPNKYNSCVVFGDVIAAYTAPATRSEKNCVFYEAEENCYRAENITATENGVAISGSELGGEAMFFDVMNSADFYTFDEGFALAWDFSEMDVTAYKYPRLLSESERNA